MTSSFSTRTYSSPTTARSSRISLSRFIFAFPRSRVRVSSLVLGPHPGGHHRFDRHVRARAERQELPGIHDAGRIERPIDALHREQVGVGEHPAHVFSLFDSDAVFACVRPPGLAAGVKALLSRPDHLVHAPWLAGADR